MSHTKLPWYSAGEFYNDYGCKYIAITEPNGIDEVVGENGLSKEDAAFIVKACNEHYELNKLNKTRKRDYEVMYKLQQAGEKEISELKELVLSLYFMAGKCSCSEIPDDFNFVTPLDKAEAIKQAEES